MKKPFLYHKKGIITSTLVILFATLLLISCNNPLNINSGNTNSGPASLSNNAAGLSQQHVQLSMDNPAIKALVPVQKKFTSELLKTNGVVGTAIGLDQSGQPAILVLTQ
ncbi:MAG TPA: hypothetical protein VJ991_13900, partial [Balneolales bacterium]|nr:hypothetical protein [Balneolales bacterium]